jgi:TetR/AcrR family transcriptional regulator
MARTRRDADRTREALLEAGAELFAGRGFEGARVERIARRAGVNTAMISYHFGGKRGLYDAILEATFDPAVARLEALAASVQPAPRRLAAFIDLFVEVASRRPHLPAMLLREVLAGGRHLRPRYLSYLLTNYRVVRGILEQGRRQRSFRRVDPLLLHLGLVGSLVFFLATAPTRSRWAATRRLPLRAPSTPAYMRHIRGLVLRGLRTGPARHRQEVTR